MPRVELLPVTFDPDRLLMWADENFRRITDAIDKLASPVVGGGGGLPVPAGNVVAGTFGSNVGYGQFIFESSAVDNVIIRGAGGNIRIEDRDLTGDWVAVYYYGDAFRLWFSGPGTDRFVFHSIGRFDFMGNQLHGTGGRNWFKDSEKSDGTGLRVGAVWSRYGIYSEDGDLALGSASQRISLQNEALGWIDINGFNTGECYMGISGAHGGAWSQFSKAAYWNSSGSYGMMHDGTYVLLSADNVSLRYQNGDRFFSDVNGSHLASRLALRDNSIWTRAWNDDWHVHGWWGGNDGLRITEYGGLYFRVRDQDPHMRMEAYATTVFARFDQLGGWDTATLIVRSFGGGSPAMISWHAQGQNAAHLIKNWFSALECRSWDNGGWGIFRGELEDYSSIQAKDNVKPATQKMSKATRKSKIKKIQTKHFNRKRGGCANCAGTGLLRENRGIQGPAISDPEKRKVLPVIAGLFGGSLDESPCPDCNGQGMAFMHEHDIKNEEAGWFGFIAEELEPEFPEAVYYRPSESDTSKIEVSGISLQALVAVLWEEVKDFEERLAGLESK